MRRPLRDLLKDRSAATAVEYGLILATVAALILVALADVAGESTSLWTTIHDNASAAIARTAP